MLTLIAAAFVASHIAAIAWAVWRSLADPEITARESGARANAFYLWLS
jgi:hypothetical protein